MKKLLMAAAVAACFVTTPAMAQGMGLYANGGLTHVDASDMDISFEAVTVRVGSRFAPNFAVEGEGTFGFEQDRLDGDIYELNSDFGAYGVVLLPMTENADLFARLGWGRTTIEAAGEDMENDDVRYGVGAQFFFNETSGVRIDFTRYNLGEDVDGDAYTVSYAHKF